MADLLYYVVEKMAGIHDVLMTLNDSYETMFSDKELHCFLSFFRCSKRSAGIMFW